VTERSTPVAFLGAWRIETMQLWAKDAIELLGPGMFIFEDEAFGEFRFIAVRGWMDCRFGERDGKPLVEFSWQGKDERDDASGRGWAVIDETGALSGRLYFHQGDDSAFLATRTDGGRAAARRPRARLRKL
jgi:hypothetical protein